LKRDRRDGFLSGLLDGLPQQGFRAIDTLIEFAQGFQFVAGKRRETAAAAQQLGQRLREVAKRPAP